MNRRQSGALRVVLLSAGLAVLCSPSGWTPEARRGAAKELLSVRESWPQGYADQLRLTEGTFQEHAAALERAQTSSRIEGKRVDSNASAAPLVDVRVDDHGDFERVVFEWPAAIDYDVVQHAEQVTITFNRPGRIDLSRITDHRGRVVVDAWAEDGDATASVTLRVLPNARVRSFNLDDGRVAIDFFGGAVSQSLALPAPDPEHDATRELRRALEQRDAVIEQLLTRFEQQAARFEQQAARIEQLERAVGLSSLDLDRVTAGGAGATPWGEDMPRPSPRRPSVAAYETPSGRPSGEAPAARSTPATSEQQSATTGQGQGPENTGAPEETTQSQVTEPGQVEIDEEAVERALDFTLVAQGALLLPVGRVELAPRFTYTRREGDFPVVVDPGGANLLGEREVRRNEFDFFAGLQVGLPLDAQLELGLPYNLVDQSIADQVGGREVEESSEMGHGLGDFSVGLAKTVLREERWWPDVILRVNWDTGTGERVNHDLALDGGFQEIRGSVSLAKRQDPLVFVGGAFYGTAFEDDDIDPGDQFGFNVGTFLAASPRTSLSLVLNQSFIDEVEVGGQRIDGSDRVESILSFGAGAVLGRNVLLSGSVGVGLTNDSPDYSVSISLPIRFSTPGL
ncbi:MAG: hypothetical protein K0R41_1422 [Geminicoccaceae bacterium]|nr:hypothetical protein [Geminicoccaceae bacterium]